MNISILNQYSKDCENEYNQVNFWFHCLNEIKTQNQILKDTVDSEIYLLEKGSRSMQKLIKGYIDLTISNSDEPSQVWTLTNIFTGLVETISNLFSDNTTLLHSVINRYYARINNDIFNLSKTILNKTNHYLRLIKESKKNYNSIHSTYMNLESQLEKAHLDKKVIETDAKSIYNVQIKEKAELSILSLLKSVNDLKPSFKMLIEDYNNKKEMLNSCMRENFELIVNLVIICNQRIKDTFSDVTKIKKDLLFKTKKYSLERIEKLKDVDFILNNFAEIKYAESKNKKFHRDNVETILNENINPDINLSFEGEDLINFTENSINCFLIRGNLINSFSKILIDFSINEHKFSESYLVINKNIQNLIQSFSFIGTGVKKSWDLFKTIYDISQKIHSNFSKMLSSSVYPVFESISIQYDSNYKEFTKNWSKYHKQIESSIDSFKNILNQNINLKFKKKENLELIMNSADSNKANNKGEKIAGLTDNERTIEENNTDLFLNFKTTLSNSKISIKKTLNLLRENEKKILKLVLENINKISKFYVNFFDQLEDLIKMHLDLTNQIDIYSDVKEIFLSYINKYELSEDYFDKILIKNIKFFSQMQGNAKVEFNDNMVLNIDEMVNISQNNNNLKIEDNQSVIYDISLKNKSYFSVQSGSKSEDSKKSSSKILVDKKTENIFDDKQDYSIDLISKNVSFVKIDSISVKTLDKQKNYQIDLKEYLDKLDKFKQVDIKEIIKLNKDGQRLYENIFYIDQDEEVIDNFNCAYEDKILLQGVLYITNKKLFFYSWFNNKTLFGATKMLIPMNDVLKIEKKYNCKIFDNSILITTKITELFFTSFVFRDKCYDIVFDLYQKINTNEKKINQEKDENKENEQFEQLMQSKNFNNKLKSNFSKSPYIFSYLKKYNFTEKLNEITEKNKKSFMEDNVLRSDTSFSKTYFKYESIGNLPLPIIYKQIFDFKNVCNEMGRGKCFWESLFESRGDKNLIIEFDNTKTPQFYDDIEYFMSLFLNFDQEINVKAFIDEIDNWPKIMKIIKSSLNHPMKKKMFMPDYVTLNDQMKLFFISPKLFIAEIVNHSSGFMYSDTFHTITQYVFETNYVYDYKEEIFKFNTNVSVHFTTEFTKSCLFKSMIESEGHRESEENLKHITFEKFKIVFNAHTDLFNEKFAKLNDEKKSLPIELNFEEGNLINVHQMLKEEQQTCLICKNDISFQLISEKKIIYQILEMYFYKIITILIITYFLIWFYRLGLNDLEKVYNIFSLAFLILVFLKFNNNNI